MQKMSQTPQRPISLTIIPQPPKNVSPPAGTTAATTQIPAFSYTQQIVNPIPAPVSNDKEIIRAQQNRDRQRRHNEKVKPFKQIATIDNNEEKIAALILVIYPELTGVPKYLVHQEVDLFIRALKDKFSK